MRVRATAYSGVHSTTVGNQQKCRPSAIVGHLCPSRWTLAGRVVSEKAALQYRSLALCWLGGPPTQDGVQAHV